MSNSDTKATKVDPDNIQLKQTGQFDKVWFNEEHQYNN